MAKIYDMTDTWTASGTTYTAVKMNVTNTASAAGSLLMDLQIAGVSLFKVDKTGALTTTGINNTGNTTLGDASADTLTINAGTWTIGSNNTQTRALGAAAAGANAIQNFLTTASGDAGGTSILRPYNYEIDVSGSANLTTVNNARYDSMHLGSGTVTNMRANNGTLTLGSTGNVTNATTYLSAITLTSSGNVTNGVQFSAGPPTLSSTGVITNSTGFQASNVSNAAITTAIGFDCSDTTAAITLTAAFRGQNAAATGKWNFYGVGTANNAFAGNVRIGSVVAPTVALDVTGAGQFSSTSTATAFIPSDSTVPTNGIYLPAANTLGFATNSALVFQISPTGQLGLGTAPSAGRNFDCGATLTGSTSSFGMVFRGVTQSDVTANSQQFRSIIQTAAAAFTLTSAVGYHSGQGTIGAGSAITNLTGFLADSSLTGGTNCYGFRSDIAASAGHWAFYNNGGARSLFNGDLTIFGGTAIPAGGTAGTGYMFSSTANFGIFFGSGAPTLSAAKGSLYLRSDGSTTITRAYINTDGGTTWTPITTVG